MRARSIVTAVAAASIHVAIAPESHAATTLSMGDLVIDGSRYLDQPVVVSGCNIIGATRWAAICDGYGSGSIPLAEIIMDGPSMDRDSLRDAIERCGNNYSPTPACAADVAGILYYLPCTASGGGPCFGMRAATISWKK